MAFFGITIEEIDKIWHHPNADKLDLALLKNMSFQFIVGRNNWRAGDKCLYFPVDSIVPKNIQKILGVEGRLAGKNKDRIKTIKLRGEISQGMIAPLSLIDELKEEKTVENITKFLGITKYEPEPIFINKAKLLPLPNGMSVYDIEGADRYKEVLDEMMDLRVNITEKLEGTNFSILYDKTKDKVYVNSHRLTIVPIGDNLPTAWKCAKEQKIIELAKQIDGNEVILFGELCGPGIQKNIYNLKEHKVFLFDIKVDGRFMDINNFTFATLSHLKVPTIATDTILKHWLNNKTIQDASNGISILNNNIKREGIVIKPMVEQYNKALHSRLILKQRSPEYLAKSKL